MSRRTSIEDHAIVSTPQERERIRTAVQGLFGGGESTEGGLFHGLIRRGPGAGELMLQPDPLDGREWAVIRIDDVVAPNALRRVPRDLLPGRLRRHDLYFVPLRAGAVVRAMWEKAAIVSVRPQYESDDAASGGRPGPEPVAKQGSCTETAGACPPAIGGAGYPCASAGAFCRAFGIRPCTGTCSTVTSWIWTCRCDCC